MLLLSTIQSSNQITLRDELEKPRTERNDIFIATSAENKWGLLQEDSNHIQDFSVPVIFWFYLNLSTQMEAAESKNM